MSHVKWDIGIDWPYHDSQMISEYHTVHNDQGEIAYVFGDTPEIRLENARLMAAAPDLLAALTRCRGQWIHSVNKEKCLAAITKATGGTP